MSFHKTFKDSNKMKLSLYEFSDIVPKNECLCGSNLNICNPPKHHLDKGTGNSSGPGWPYPQPGYE